MAQSVKKKTPPAHSPAGNGRLRRRRSLAKAGMLGTMGTLVATALMRGRGPKSVHLWAGVALLGFSYWHSRLYPTDYQNRKA